MKKSVSKPTPCDTLIIGSSMAGGCLARQLKLQHPEMKIIVLEKKRNFDYWVGESTLESFWDYAVRYLHLGHYLDTNHLYKHGLRFFYDSPAHDLPIQEMSEVGRSWYHTTPAHQIDRKRFDSDIYRMNVDAGIDVRLGVKVKNVDINADSQHLVEASDGSYQCRWLVDAAGFGSPLGKKFDLIKSNNNHHPLECYWGRFKNLANLDLLGDAAWRNRVHHTTRTLATTHFMYGGYWMWLIPIDRDTFSLGLTVRTDLACDIKIDNGSDFIAFLKTHECMRQLLSDKAELQDFSQLKGFSRQAGQCFSHDRWFLTGISAAMLDPLLSPGSALLADNNRMIGDLIATDMAGDTKAFSNKIKAYNAYSKIWQENFFLHIKGHYHDCFDRQRANFETLLMQWFGVVLPISMAENWGYDPGMDDEMFDTLEHKAMAMLENSYIRKVDEVIEQFHEFLRANNAEYENNKGKFYDIEIGDRFTYNTRTNGSKLCEKSIAEIEKQMLVVAIHRSLTRMAQIQHLDANEELIANISHEIIDKNYTLTHGLELMAQSISDGNVCRVA